MEPLFTIECSTCRTRLKVRNEAAIGQILTCPKCQSMVQISPPPGWQPPPKPVVAAPPKETPGKAAPTAKGVVGAKCEGDGATQSKSADEGGSALAGETIADSKVQSELGVESEDRSRPAGGTYSEDYAPPFGFERKARPGWQKWGLVAAAAGLVIAVIVGIWSNSGEPEQVAQQPAASDADLKAAKAPPDPGAAATDPIKSGEPSPSAPPKLPATSDPKTQPATADPVKTAPLNPEPAVKTPDPKPVVHDPPVRSLTKEPDPIQKPPLKTVDLKTAPLLPSPVPELPGAKPDPEPLAAPQPLKRAEVETRLAEAIPAIELPGVSLSAAVDLLSQLSALKITLDLESLSASGVTAEDPVTIELSKTTVAEVLERILDQRGLVYVIEAGQVLVTSHKHQRDVLRLAHYDVADLTRGAPDGGELMELMRRMIEPGSWRAATADPGKNAPNDPGAPGNEKISGTMECLAGKLSIEHNDWVHRRAEALLAKLRVARGLSADTPKAAEQILATRLSRVEAKLLKPLTVNYSDLPLSRILSGLEKRCELRLLIDSLALDAAGQSPNVRASVQTKEPQTLAFVLASLLTPLDLSYRIVDEKTLQITSRPAATEQLDLEFYRVRDLAPGAPAASDLIERIKREIGPGTWNLPSGGGGLSFDPLSHCLIVSHNQSVQVQIADLLDTLRRPVEEPQKKP